VFEKFAIVVIVVVRGEDKKEKKVLSENIAS